MRTSKKLLLALDTSSRTAGLAIYDGSEVLCEYSWTSWDHHTVELAPAIAEAFNRTGITLTDLAALAVAQGPGSFTGLRIGLALAKGMAMARHLPLIAIPTLDILAAAQLPQSVPMIALLRAGRGRLAAGWYQYFDSAWRSTGSVAVLTINELIQQTKASTWICGELTPVERNSLNQQCPDAVLASPAFSLRRTGFLAELAWKNWRDGKTSDPATLSPIYLHYNEPIPV